VASAYKRIERTPVDREVLGLTQEVAAAGRWLARVLAEGHTVPYDRDPEVELEALKEHLRQELLRLEESSSSGRFLR
jgi:hypothetical protein